MINDASDRNNRSEPEGRRILWTLCHLPIIAVIIWLFIFFTHSFASPSGEFTEDDIILPWDNSIDETTYRKRATGFEFRFRTKSESASGGLADYKNSTRIKFRSNNYELRFLSNISNFYAGSLGIQGRNNDYLILGNYSLNFGLGLVFRAPDYYQQLFVNRPSVSPLNRVSTLDYLFGAVTKIELNRDFSLITYFSRNRLVSNQKFKEDLVGARTAYSKGFFILGLTSYLNSYNPQIERVPRNLLVLGTDVQFKANNYTLTSEVGYLPIFKSFGSGFKIMGDFKNLDIGIGLIYTTKNFLSPHSIFQNLLPRKTNRIIGFTIFNYRFFGFNFQISARSRFDEESDTLPGRLKVSIKRGVEKLKMRIEHKINFSSDIPETYGTLLDLSYPIANATLGLRIEDRYSQFNSNRGSLYSGSGQLRVRGLDLEVRLSFFNVSSYATRLYLYESGFWNNYRLTGNGFRGYFGLGYQAKNNWLRIKTGLGINKFLSIPKPTIGVGLQIEMKGVIDTKPYPPQADFVD